MNFEQLVTTLKNLKNSTKYREILFNSDISLFSPHEKSKVIIWRKREVAMITIYLMNFKDFMYHLKNPDLHIDFDKSVKDDPDEYFTYNRTYDNTLGVNNDFISYDFRDTLRYLSYNKFIEQYFGSYQNLRNKY